jgi:membrane protein DedA with SNARE-associated domain
MDPLIQAILNAFGGLSYPGIFFLMALESSLFPVPSELVMIPAGYMASIGKLSFPLIVLTGALGSLAGAWGNYLLGRYVGKPFVVKYGKYFLINHEKYLEAEQLFDKNDRLYTFLGRFIPVVRHLISIPAGIFRMSPKIFSFLTFAGAGLWCWVLASTGYVFGKKVLGVVREYSHQAEIAVSVAVIAFVLWFLFHHTKKRRKAAE